MMKLFDLFKPQPTTQQEIANMTHDECFDKLCETGIPRSLWESFSPEVREEIRKTFERTVREFTPEEATAFNTIRNNPIAAQDIVEQSEMPTDNVNHPAHYTAGGIECIDAIESALTPEEARGYCKGNALKYVWRERHKGGDESLEKAIWYLQRALKK